MAKANVKRGKSAKRVLWALDPFAEQSEGWQRAAEFIKVMSQKKNYVIEPIHVLGKESLNWVGYMAQPDMKTFLPMVNDSIQKVLDEVGLTNAVAPKIILDQSTSRMSEVNKLLKYADRVSAEFIVLNTHARSTVSQILMGSFAQKVLYKSKRPLVFISPHMKPIEKLDAALFATDFSSVCKKAYDKFLSLYSGVLKEIKIFHKVPQPAEAFIQSGVVVAGGGWISVERFLHKESETRKKMGQKWLEAAKKKGLKATVELDSTSGLSADGVIQQAKSQDIDMIAMGSEAKPLSSIVWGSVAKVVIQNATKPVWISHKI